MLHKISSLAAIMICSLLISTHATHATVRKADVIKKAKQYGKKTGWVAWHAGQTAVGGFFSWLTAMKSIIPEIKDRTFFKDIGNIVLTAGTATIAITCLQDGIHGLDRELQIKRFLRKVLRRRRAISK